MNARERRSLKHQLKNSRCRACRARDLGMYGEEPMCFHCGATGDDAWGAEGYQRWSRFQQGLVQNQPAKESQDG